MRSTLLASGLFGLKAAAWPAVMEMVARDTPAVALSKARTNCGVIPCTTFDATEQYVSTSGEYAFVAPASTDIRGPCPGLNAAANHGYLDRSGVVTILDTVTGLGDAYGMTADLAAFLAAYAIIFDGDPIEGTWSIGGPPPSDPLDLGLIGGAQGISYSHNIYEGDVSIARFDAYLNGGDAQELSLYRFRAAYEVGHAADRWTLDDFSRDFDRKTTWSIANNPLYFTGLFSTTLVSPAAYNFVINFMSNHTEAEPSGYLNGAIFKEFFAITGDYPDFTWTPGHERIPDNWYRRPLAEGYSIPGVFEDLGVEFLAYPGTFRIGGNEDGVNTYTGVTLADLTGGAYTDADLKDYKNTTAATCFLAEFVSQLIPNAADVGVTKLAAINKLITDHITPITGGASCPALNAIDATPFSKYKGYTYHPTGPATSGGPKTGDDKPDCCPADGPE